MAGQPLSLKMEAMEAHPHSRAAFTGAQWYVLVIMTAIYACHALDRAVIAVVIEPMKADLHLDDTGVGIIAGLGYGCAFALAALPMGMLVDRFNRVRLMSALVMLWSAMTAAAGIAQNLLSLLLARIGVGAAEAGGQPAALSILSDYFPPDRRATALGVLYLGAALGYATSNILGGLAAQEFGWRAAFFLAGVPGLLLGLLLMVSVREPVRGGGADASSKAPPMRDVLRTIIGNPVVVHTTVGMVIAAFSITVVTVWIVPLLMREHGFTVAQAGLIVAIAAGFSQAIGALLAGSLADRLARRAPQGIVIVPAVGLALSTPLTVAICFTPSATVAVALFIAFGLLLSCWTAPGYTAILGQLSDRMRGATMSLVQIGCSFIGASLGPFVAGALSDAIGGPHSLAASMSLCSIGGLWSAAHFLRAGRAIRTMAEG